MLTNLTKCERIIFGRYDERSDFACSHIVKHDQNCTFRDRSFWTWVNTYIFNLISSSSAYPSDRNAIIDLYIDLQSVLKLIVNLIASEDEYVSYFMSLALKDLLEQILLWNS